MIKQLYYSKMEEAINGAKLNGLACYYDIEADIKTWYENNDYLEIIYFENTKSNK